MAAGSSWAQGGEKGDENRKERMAKLKRAFIEEELEMTAEESEKFMPLYDKKEKDLMRIRVEMKEERKKGKKNEDMTEKEFLASVERVSELRKEEVDVMEDFLKSALPVLGLERTKKLPELDKRFKMRLEQRMKEREMDQRRQERPMDRD